MVDHDAWIHMPSLEEADGELRFLYERLRDRRTSEVDNILRIHGQHPATLAAHHELYRVLMHGPSGLSRRQREMVAVMVSAINQCHYWLVHHGAGLLRLTGDPRFVQRLGADWREVQLGEQDAAMLAYADKLTRSPAAMTRQDVERLLTVGFSERDVLDLNQVAGYFAYVNRLADGLGVPLEGFWDDGQPHPPRSGSQAAE